MLAVPVSADPDAVVILPLDENGGTTAGDISGQGNNGTLLGGASFEAASGDGSVSSVRFDAVDDYIDLGTIDVNGSGVTIACWFEAQGFPGPSNDPRLVSKADGDAANNHIFMLSTVLSSSEIRLRARIRTGGVTATVVASSGAMIPGVWYHAAVTYDGAFVRLYLDGGEVGVAPLTGAVDTDATMPVTVGSQPPGLGARFFDGLIDDVRIYQRGLSAGEILAIVNGTGNQAPVAVDDDYATQENTQLVVNAANGVLDNDIDGDFDPLTAALVDDVSNGVLNLNADGSFDYTPDFAFVGTDTFTYFANDTTENSNLGTVTIDVTPIPIPDELVMLPLDENGGGVAGDTSGQGNDGTLERGAAFSASSADGSTSSVRFDGIDDYIALGPLDVAGGELTLACWFNADDLGDAMRLIAKSSGAEANEQVFMLGATRIGGEVRLRGDLRVAGTTTTLVAGSGPIAAGQWMHATLTYDGIDVRLYLDAVEVGTTPMTGTVDTDPALAVTIAAGVVRDPHGKDGPAPDIATTSGQSTATEVAFFEGRIDDVRILQRPLSPSEVSEIVNGPPVNTPPVAVDDTYNATENVQLVIDAANGVLDNDSDADADSLTAVLDVDVANGTLNLNFDGSFDYTPDLDYAGPDSFTYHANDGEDDSNIATVRIDVAAAPNQPPVAVNDSYVTGQNVQLVVSAAAGVLDNDSDADGDSLTANLVDDVADGVLNLNLDGSFDYTPDLDFTGSDSFTYRANDGLENSNLATVNITVSAPGGPNEPPRVVTGTLVWTREIIGTGVDNAHAVIAADLDGDGDTDAAATDFVDDTVFWFENDGGNWIARVVDSNLDGAYPAYVGDLDDDGDQDLMACGYEGDDIVWYENDGFGNFTRRDVDLDANGAHSVVPVDLDDDGDKDLVTTNQDGNSVDWYENNGSEVFTRRDIDTAAHGAKWGEPVDLDEDGDIDVLAASYFANEVAWHENNGSESFTQRTIETGAAGAYYVYPADLNGDGDIDVVSASELDNTIGMYINDGSENFTIQSIDTQAMGARTVLAADLDLDGDEDVLSASVNDDRVSWYENDGSANFTKKTIDGDADGAYGLYIYDMEPDGDPDVLSARRDAFDVAVHYSSRTHQAFLTTVGGTLLIDTSELNTLDVDDGPAELTYTITTAPAIGTITLDGSPIGQGGTFTQADVNNNLVEYTHDGSPGVADGFAFTVADGGEGGYVPITGFFAISIPDVSSIAHWPLDESSGTTAADISGSNDGTLVNGPVWLPSTGRIGGALEFDGSNDYVDIGTMDIPAGTGMTIAMWVRLDASSGSARLISKATGAGEQDHYWMISTQFGTSVRFRLKAGGSTTTLVSPANQLVLGEWVHVAVTYDQSDMRIYVDGGQVAITSKSGAVDVNPAVGAAMGDQPSGAGSDPFNGALDEVRIYDRALSGAEVALLANPPAAIVAGQLAEETPVTARVGHTRLRNNVPNPFNPTTTLRYELAQGGHVSLQIFDVRGRLVRTVVDAVRPPGENRATWNARDDRGERVGSGVYFVRLRAGSVVDTRKIVLIE